MTPAGTSTSLTFRMKGMTTHTHTHTHTLVHIERVCPLCRVSSEVFVTSIIDPPLGGSMRVDHVPDWQPLMHTTGYMVEARSVNVKNAQLGDAQKANKMRSDFSLNKT